MLLDREFYLPRIGTDDTACLQKVDVGGTCLPFMSKLQWTGCMLERVQVAVVRGDAVYGHSCDLRIWLED